MADLGNDGGMGWYVVHTYSGFENKAKLALEERIRSLGHEEDFGEILVPEEQVTERTKTGKTRKASKRFYPGYILVQMYMTNVSWHVVKDTAKVIGFVGGTNKNPARVPEHEIQKVIAQLEDGAPEHVTTAQYDKGDNIRVIEGPFANFNGIVDEVRPEKQKMRVMVSIFGRATPVELDFNQVEKA